MQRFIDVEKVELKGLAIFDENLDVLIPLSEVRKALQMTPTEDVVAKSEVERLTVELNAMRGAANSYKMHYENAKAQIEHLTAAKERLNNLIQESMKG